MKTLIIFTALVFASLSQINAQNPTTYSIENTFIIPNDSQKTIVFDNVVIAKKEKYTLTVQGYMKGDFSRHIWSSDEHSIKSSFDFSVGIFAPFTANPNSSVSTFSIYTYECGPAFLSSDFEGTCTDYIMFSQTFTITADVTNDRCFQVFFINNNSKVEYKQLNNSANLSFKFPVILKENTKVIVKKVK